MKKGPPRPFPERALMREIDPPGRFAAHRGGTAFTGLSMPAAARLL